MKRLTSISVLFSACCLAAFLLVACKKSKEDVAASNEPTLTEKQQFSMRIFGNTEFRLNSADQAYLNSLKSYTAMVKQASVAPGPTSGGCAVSGGTNMYGYFSDPENIVVEGPYTAASSPTYENNAAACLSSQNVVANAMNYLDLNGYHDLIVQFQGEDPSLAAIKSVHAANALLYLRSQLPLVESKGTQGRVVECILQSIGVAALADIMANWATASRTYLIKAAGKLAARYLNWFGAALAIANFIDCMWG